MDRRQFLRYGLGVAGAGLFALGLADLQNPRLLSPTTVKTSSVTSVTSGIPPSTTSSSSTISQISSLPDYQAFLSWLQSVSGPYSGKSLNISLEAEFGPYATQLIDSDFTAATGIRDQYNIVPYALQLDDISLMASTQSSAYDCYSLDVENLGVFPNLPVSPYELMDEYPNLTYPEINLDDFTRFSWDRIATYPPDLSGGNGGSSAADVTVLPFDTPTMVLFYRKDIYDKLELTPAATWDDHYANCQAIQNSGLAPFGSASMAINGISVIYEYQAHLASFGGSLWAVDGNSITPTVNTDAALAALEDYVRFGPVSDVGSVTYDWDGVFNSLSLGTSGSALLFDGFATWLDDPIRSRFPGLFGYAQNPAGPEGSFHPYAGSGIGVSKYSNNIEMAWLWAQWATAKGAQEAKILGEYHNFPTRVSVMQAPEVTSVINTPDLAVAALVNQVWQSNSLTTLLGFPQWLNAAVILSTALTGAWNGGLTPTQALNGAQTKLEAMGTMTF